MQGKYINYGGVIDAKPHGSSSGVNNHILPQIDPRPRDTARDSLMELMTSANASVVVT